MDISDETTAALSPLEQRRTRLRAFADRVLEAVEALPMPKNAADAERTLRTVTAADRMLVQLYKRITTLQQINPAKANQTAYRSDVQQGTEETAPFVYIYDDDVREQPPKSLSPEACAVFERERLTNPIFDEYLKAAAKKSEDTNGANAEPP